MKVVGEIMDNDIIFLFDLDSTITKQSIFKVLTDKYNKNIEIKGFVDKIKSGEYSFRESFLALIETLDDKPVDEIADIISNFNVSKNILKFINKNKNKCYIVTSHLDVWVDKLIKNIGMEDRCFSSIAEVKKNKVTKVKKIISKSEIIEKFDSKIVAIGNAFNDRSMLEKADISIGYGGVYDVSCVLLESVDYVFLDDLKLCKFLSKLL